MQSSFDCAVAKDAVSNSQGLAKEEAPTMIAFEAARRRADDLVVRQMPQRITSPTARLSATTQVKPDQLEKHRAHCLMITAAL
jgi:hypothetical protein